MHKLKESEIASLTHSLQVAKSDFAPPSPSSHHHLCLSAFPPMSALSLSHANHGMEGLDAN